MNSLKHFLLIAIKLHLAKSHIVGPDAMTKIEKHPYFVLIQVTTVDEFGEKEYFHCGGAIVAKRWIMTAGHCIDQDVHSRTEIMAGMDDIGYIEQAIQVIQLIRHKDYDDETLNNDIALMKLEDELRFSQSVDAIFLPKKGEEMNFTTGKIMGFGSTAENETTMSDELRSVTINLLTDDHCLVDERYKNASMLCAGVLEGGRDSCSDDSGGPLVVKRANNQSIVIGIISFGPRGPTCARKNSYGVFTRVSSYLEWIEGRILS